MAKKGTYTALQAQAGQVDFGEVARTVTGDIEAKRQTLLKEQLLKSQQEQQQRQYTQKLREQSFKDTVAFSKEAKDMMNIDTSGMLNPVLTEVLKTSQNDYADMMREYAGADTGRRAELNIEMQRYKSISGNINALSEGINSLFKDYGSLVNGKPKYSAFGSSKSVLGIIQAIKAAATQGLTKNKDGSYNWGDRITIDNMGTPDMKFKIRGKDGEQLANNSMEAITSTLSADLKPYNDISGAVQKIAAAVQPSMRTDVKVGLDNTTLTYDKLVDIPKTMKSIRAHIDNYIGSDDTDIMEELRFNGTYGDIPDEIRENMSKSIFDMQKRDHATRISKSPIAQNNIKAQNTTNRTNRIRSAIMAEGTASRDMLNGKWPDAGGGRITSWTKAGDNIQMTIEQGTGKNKRTIPLQYDIANPQTFNFIKGMVNDVLGAKPGESTVLTKDIKMSSNVADYRAAPDQLGEFAFETPKAANYDRTIKNIDNLATQNLTDQDAATRRAAIENTIAPYKSELEAKGYDFNVGLSSILGKYEMTIKKDGKQVFFNKFPNTAKGLENFTKALKGQVEKAEGTESPTPTTAAGTTPTEEVKGTINTETANDF